MHSFLSSLLEQPCLLRCSACVSAPIGTNVTEYITIDVYCPSNPITNFISNTPLGMTKSDIIVLTASKRIAHVKLVLLIIPPADTSEIILNWIPIDAQSGIQVFCAVAMDSTSVPSNQYCLTFLVGASLAPEFIQSSASPVGTIFANHMIFSIQSNALHAKQRDPPCFI